MTARATGELAAPERPLSDARTFPCESCGADLEFSIGAQSLKCPYCGHEKALDAPAEGVEERDFQAELERLGRKRAAPDAGTQEVSCETCGATVVFEGALTSTECAYCGSPMQRDRVHSAGERVGVDGIVPFAIERERARRSLDEWVRTRWFAPGDFKLSGTRGKFNGVYFPFWTFDSMTSSRYRGQRGDAYYETVGSGKNRRTVRRVRWTRVSGEFQHFFDDVLVCAAKTVQTHLLERLEPWPLEAARPFDAGVVAGYAAFTYDQSLGEGFDVARGRMDASLARRACELIGGDEQRLDDLRTRYAAITYKHLLLPAWILAYRYHEKSYQVVVNATTGRVSGERPYSAWKIALAVLAALALVVALAYLDGRRG